ncbi:DsbA family protein [Streptomyces sp. XM83C]|uniref:DsbA family protein n=1 Tax=Streptomyces thermocoprophilus TaxID=78356 RepID=A0ABV5VAF3_9ACTN|nr:thioredoxin domain-containing protein [Streptomyces sp. XM83C]MCK1820440.1 DsbA family protein [Streptomyces sp. XM83C]
MPHTADRTAATRTATRRRAATATALFALLVASATGCGDRSEGKTDGKGTDDKPASGSYTTVSAIPESIAPDGTTIRVGSPQAHTVVHLYEDLRCPVCKDFETQGSGESLRTMVMTGKVRVEYTLASFLDDRLGGQGSVKAANALRAAVDQGKFVEYHELLYRNQPEESVDGFTDAYLLETASKVEGLRGPAFDAAVKGMKHRAFVTASEKAFETSGAQGTPSMKVNGKLVGSAMSDMMFDPASLPLLITLMSA